MIFRRLFLSHPQSKRTLPGKYPRALSDSFKLERLFTSANVINFMAVIYPLRQTTRGYSQYWRDCFSLFINQRSYSLGVFIVFPIKKNRISPLLWAFRNFSGALDPLALGLLGLISQISSGGNISSFLNLENHFPSYYSFYLFFNLLYLIYFIYSIYSYNSPYKSP